MHLFIIFTWHEELQNSYAALYKYSLATTEICDGESIQYKQAWTVAYCLQQGDVSGVHAVWL